MGILGFNDSGIWGFAYLEILGFRDRIVGDSGIWIFGYLGFRVSGVPVFWGFGHLGFLGFKDLNI